MLFDFKERKMYLSIRTGCYEKIISLGLAFLMTVTCLTALSITSVKASESIEEPLSISDFTEENTEIISYDEMVNEIAQNRGISVSEAKEANPDLSKSPATRVADGLN